MPSPIKIPVCCDTAFYDVVTRYAEERGRSVSAVLREALIERMEREKRRAPGAASSPPDKRRRGPR